MDKKLLSLVVVFILLFSAFTISVFFNKQLQTITRAKGFYTPSGQKSLIFAFPLEVKANGKDFSKISVFVRNEEGVPISNKRVSIQTNLGVIEPINDTTDKTGKAEFKITSSEEGIAVIKAEVENIPIQQQVSIKFVK